jgi:hypothetical protein
LECGQQHNVLYTWPHSKTLHSKLVVPTLTSADETAPPRSARDGMTPLSRLKLRGTNSTCHNISKHYAINVYWGDGKAPPFLNLGFTTLPLYPTGQNPHYPLDMRLGGPQRWYRWKRKISCPCQESNLGCPAHSLVTTPVEVSELKYSEGSLKDMKLL